MPHTILCVDDDPIARNLRCHVLRRAGYDVREASSGAEALRAIGSEPLPALVVLDIQLPDTNGFAVCRQLKCDPRTASIPVLHISTLGQAEHGLPEALASQAEAYLKEPVEPALLISTVKALIREGEAHQHAFGILESIPDAYLSFDGEFRYLYINPAAEQMLSRTRAALAGRTVWEEFPSIIGTPAEYHYRRSMTERVATRFEYFYQVWNRWYDIRTFPSSAGGMTVIFRDITEQKLEHDALLRNRQLLDLASTAGRTGAFDWDLRTHAVHVTPALERLYGYEPGSAGTDYAFWIEHVAPTDRVRVEALLADCFAGRQSDNVFDMPVVIRDGSAKWLHHRATVEYDASGRPLRMIGIQMDITGQVEAGAALRESEERYRRFVDLSSVGMWRWDMVPPVPVNLPEREQAERIIACGVAAECNDAMAKQRGYARREDVLGHSTGETMAERGAQQIEILVALIRNGYVLSDYQLPDHDRAGNLGVYIANVVGVVKDGALQCIWGTRNDITPRIRAEEALRESELRWSTLAETVPNILFTAGPDGRGDYVSTRMYEYTGLPPGALEDYGWAGIVHPDDLENARDAWARALQTGTPVSHENRLRRADGAYRWFLIRIAPMHDSSGNVVKWFGVCTDIDDLKSLGEQLTAKTRELQLLNERLRESNVELQQLASFVAHDLQSPLNAVHSATDLLGAEFPKPMGQDAKEYFDLIHTAAGRMDTLIRSLAQYSRIASGAGNPSAPVDCNQVLSRTLMIFSNEIRASASVVTSDPLPTLQAEPDQMEQLCQNLIGNALKYRKPDQPAHIHISAALHEDEWVFSIQDDGIGIDMMKAGRIFKPFERLPGAARYGGAGLGLAICHRIVERHQGRIWFHSEPGQGATFYFALPAPLR